MLAVRRFCLGSSLLVLCAAGCDRGPPVQPVLEAASTGVPGPTVKAPSNTNAVAMSHSRIDVSWQDNSTNETGFEVHRSTSGPSGPFTLRAATGANITSYSDAGLEPLTQYCYEVRAFKDYDGRTSFSEFSNTTCATTLPPPVPAAPSGTDAKPAMSTAVDLIWIDNSTNEDGFRVERSPDPSSTWASVGTVGPNVTSFRDAGLASEQRVCYRVIAHNRGGDSPPSNTDCTTPPAAPTGLTATGIDGPAIDLAWTDNSAVEDGYEVWRATAESGPYGLVANLAASSTTYHDVGVSANTTYWYQVRAQKDGGLSDFSNVASATAGSCVPTGVEICDNGLDDDCNGLIDADDPACPGPGSGCPYGDCFSDFCGPGYVCAPNGCCEPHCGNGYQDGDESDVDCGGSCGSTCQSGQHCYGNYDCASGSCVNNICQ